MVYRINNSNDDANCNNQNYESNLTEETTTDTVKTTTVITAEFISDSYSNNSNRYSNDNSDADENLDSTNTDTTITNTTENTDTADSDNYNRNCHYNSDDDTEISTDTESTTESENQQNSAQFFSSSFNSRNYNRNCKSILDDSSDETSDEEEKYPQYRFRDVPNEKFDFEAVSSEDVSGANFKTPEKQKRLLPPDEEENRWPEEPMLGLFAEIEKIPVPNVPYSKLPWRKQANLAVQVQKALGTFQPETIPEKVLKDKDPLKPTDPRLSFQLWNDFKSCV